MRYFAAARGVICGMVLLATAAVAQQSAQPPSKPAKEVPPFVLPAGVAVEQDLVYARYGDRELHLESYRPERGDGPYPGIVFVHGGGWSAGSRTQFRRQAAYLATKGYVSATIEYRFLQEAKYPAALYDCKAAVRWMRENATKYHINPDKIAASGGSAGGHLVSLLGTTNGMPNFEGNGGHAEYSSSVQAVVSFNGVYDLVALLEKPDKSPVDHILAGFLGGGLNEAPELYVEASPVAHICKDTPPFLLLHGTGDTTVPYAQVLEMQAALKGAGVRAELYSEPGAHHGFFNSSPYFEPTLQRMEEFLKSVF